MATEFFFGAAENLYGLDAVGTQEWETLTYDVTDQGIARVGDVVLADTDIFTRTGTHVAAVAIPDELNVACVSQTPAYFYLLARTQPDPDTLFTLFRISTAGAIVETWAEIPALTNAERPMFTVSPDDGTLYWVEQLSDAVHTWNLTTSTAGSNLASFTDRHGYFALALQDGTIVIGWTDDDEALFTIRWYSAAGALLGALVDVFYSEIALGENASYFYLNTATGAGIFDLTTVIAEVRVEDGALSRVFELEPLGIFDTAVFVDAPFVTFIDAPTVGDVLCLTAPPLVQCLSPGTPTVACLAAHSQQSIGCFTGVHDASANAIGLIAEDTQP